MTVKGEIFPFRAPGAVVSRLFLSSPVPVLYRCPERIEKSGKKLDNPFRLTFGLSQKGISFPPATNILRFKCFSLLLGAWNWNDSDFFLHCLSTLQWPISVHFRFDRKNLVTSRCTKSRLPLTVLYCCVWCCWFALCSLQLGTSRDHNKKDLLTTTWTKTQRKL